MTGKKKVNDFATINRLMNHRPSNKMVCITNKKEVIRILRDKANEYFFKKVSVEEHSELKRLEALGYSVVYEDKGGYYYNPIDGWFYTTKKVYRQYLDSLKPWSRTPAPTFEYQDKLNSTKPKNIYQ
jgi:hypothetical protein